MKLAVRSSLQHGRISDSAAISYEFAIDIADHEAARPRRVQSRAIVPLSIMYCLRPLDQSLDLLRVRRWLSVVVSRHLLRSEGEEDSGPRGTRLDEQATVAVDAVGVVA